MEVKDDLIPELELSIIPSKDGELQVELMNTEFVKFLKKHRVVTSDIIFLTRAELISKLENFHYWYLQYKTKVLDK